MEAKVDIHALIPLGKVEDLLSIILDRLNRHEETLTHMTHTMSTLISNTAATRKFDEMYQEISALRSRLDVVEQAATAHIEEQSIPCGELTTQNFKMLKRLHHELSLTAKQQDVSSSIANVTAQYNAHLQQLQNATAPLSLANSLQMSVTDLHRQLQHVEENLTDKVDRSEIHQLHTLSEQLQHHLGQHTALVNDVSSLQQQLSVTTSTADRNSASISNLSSHLKHMQDASSKYSAKVEVRALAKEISKLESELQLAASAQSVTQLSTRVDDAETQLAQNHTSLLTLSQQHDQLSHIVSKKADTSSLQHYVPVKQFVAVSSALKEEVATKASHITQCQHSETLENNAAVLVKHDHELAIAMRFIEWFTHRGEMYEQNMKIIDKHLQNLGRAAVQGPEIPYAGRVRMEPVMPPNDGFFDLKK